MDMQFKKTECASPPTPQTPVIPPAVLVQRRKLRPVLQQLCRELSWPAGTSHLASAERAFVSVIVVKPPAEQLCDIRTTLQVPSAAPELLEGWCLGLSYQKGQARGCRVAFTNHRGEATFTQVPVGSRCRLRLLSRSFRDVLGALMQEQGGAPKP